MDEDKRVTRPLSDERRRNDRLAETRGGSQHPMVMRGERIECLDLWTKQLTPEADCCRKWNAGRPEITEIDFDTMGSDQFESFI